MHLPCVLAPLNMNATQYTKDNVHIRELNLSLCIAVLSWLFN